MIQGLFGPQSTVEVVQGNQVVGYGFAEAITDELTMLRWALRSAYVPPPAQSMVFGVPTDQANRYASVSEFVAGVSAWFQKGKDTYIKALVSASLSIPENPVPPDAPKPPPSAPRAELDDGVMTALQGLASSSVATVYAQSFGAGQMHEYWALSKAYAAPEKAGSVQVVKSSLPYGTLEDFLKTMQAQWPSDQSFLMVTSNSYTEIPANDP